MRKENIIFSNGKVALSLLDIETYLTTKVDADMKARYKTNDNYTIEAMPGQKFIRLVKMRNGKRDGVYCFLDYDGNIYKAADWKAPEPARHIRGSIFDPDMSFGKGLNWFGAIYYR